MFINNQTGRSMIEMLGVLAIVGVLSVGGLDMISKARENKKIAELLGGVSNLGATLVQQRKHAGEVYSDYSGNYTMFIKQIGKIPAGFTFDSSVFKTALGATVKANAEDDDGLVIVTVSKLKKEACVKVATNNWGNRNSSRFVGLAVSSSGAATCPINPVTAIPGGAGYPMPIATASTACASKTNNTVYLAYDL